MEFYSDFLDIEFNPHKSRTIKRASAGEQLFSPYAYHGCAEHLWMTGDSEHDAASFVGQRIWR